MKLNGNKFSRRFVLGGLIASTANRALANAPATSIRPAAKARDFHKFSVPSADRIINEIGLTGKVGFSVADARTGLILEARNPVLGLPPASVTKTFTAQYALDSLGPTHAFTTRVVATGPIKDGVLDGDLVLVGGGDPTLDTDGLADLAVALKATGLREVLGDFIVDAQALPMIERIDANQPDHLGYNPSVSGLNLNFNRVHFEWKRSDNGYGVTMEARSDKHRPAVNVARMSIVNRDLPIYTYDGSDGVDRWSVARSALGKGGSRWLPVRRPDEYAAEVFKAFARGQGIKLKPAISGTAPADAAVVVERTSPPLRKILKDMLKYSTNLTAEVVGLSASSARGLDVNDLSSSADQMGHWAKSHLASRHPNFRDHSGLGDGTRVSASDMVAALLRTGPDSTLASLLKPIAVRNRDGKVQKNSPLTINAKTGTLNFVSALAGYVHTADGTDLAFAIFTADMDQRRAVKNSDREGPRGGKTWNTRARKVQQALISRWGILYGT